MDFFVGSVMTAPTLVACFVSFFALNHESEHLDKLCREMQYINIKYLSGVVYRGRGEQGWLNLKGLISSKLQNYIKT